MRVYHPKADGAPTPHTYLEFTNAARTKAVITQDAVPKGEVVVYPKALVPEADYSVIFRSSRVGNKAKGADLMRDGIRFSSTERGEMILFNLDDAPGLGTDHTPPTTPSKAWKQRETWNGRAGVAVRWSPSQDDGILAEYLVMRDGTLLDHVGIGTFCFDTTEGSGLEHWYEVVAVDGDGNRSTARTAAE